MDEPLLLLVDGPAAPKRLPGPEAGGGGDANGLLLDMNRLMSSLEYSSRLLPSERSDDASEMASKRC